MGLSDARTHTRPQACKEGKNAPRSDRTASSGWTGARVPPRPIASEHAGGADVLESVGLVGVRNHLPACLSVQPLRACSWPAACLPVPPAYPHTTHPPIHPSFSALYLFSLSPAQLIHPHCHTKNQMCPIETQMHRVPARRSLQEAANRVSQGAALSWALQPARLHGNAGGAPQFTGLWSVTL
jgi:hypothetical protein